MASSFTSNGTPIKQAISSNGSSWVKIQNGVVRDCNSVNRSGFFVRKIKLVMPFPFREMSNGNEIIFFMRNDLICHIAGFVQNMVTNFISN